MPSASKNKIETGRVRRSSLPARDVRSLFSRVSPSSSLSSSRGSSSGSSPLGFISLSVDHPGVRHSRMPPTPERRFARGATARRQRRALPCLINARGVGRCRSTEPADEPRERTGASCSNFLRAQGPVFTHRFYRLLRVSRTTARTRARLYRSRWRRRMARGRGVSQGWALSETQQRVQVRGCSPAESFRELAPACTMSSVWHGSRRCAWGQRSGRAIFVHWQGGKRSGGARRSGAGARRLERVWRHEPAFGPRFAAGVPSPGQRRATTVVRRRHSASVKALALASAAHRAHTACCTAGSADLPRPARGRCMRRRPVS